MRPLLAVFVVIVLAVSCSKTTGDSSDTPVETPPPYIVDTPPVVALKTVLDITVTSKQIKGKVIGYGGGDRRISGGGLVISEQLDPLFSSNIVTIAIDSADFYKSDSIFEANATNLGVQKIYHVRAYVKNKIGTYYSNELVFNTGQPPATYPKKYNVTKNQPLSIVLESNFYGRSHDPSPPPNTAVRNKMELPQGINMYVRVDSVYGNMVRFANQPNLAQVGDMYLISKDSVAEFTGVTTLAYPTWRVGYSVLLVGTTQDLTYYCNYAVSIFSNGNHYVLYSFDSPPQYGICNTQ